MITPKRRRILAIAAFLLLLYILRLKMAEPYTEIARLDVTQLHLPNIIDIYPHLVETKELESLNPALRYPDKRMPRKELIMGVPTIQRGNVSYLVSTLEQLLQKARIEDLDKIRIIVMISDVKGASSKFVQDTLTTLKDRFNDHFESGLLQVIVPPASWYPDITSLTPTFNDKPERMYWRTKQNLDYAYLMIYAARMGKLYLQLEDDIEAAADYTGTVLKYAERSEWFIIELSTLGYIGKLMRSKDIPSLAVHVLLNYQYKPIDWLLHDYCTNRYCSPEMASKVCAKEVAKHRQQVKPGMFQHVGYYSSLEGKIQKLKDKSFGVNFEPLKRESIWHGGKLRKEEIEKTFKVRGGRTMVERGPSGNPDAKITSTIGAYQRFTLEGMYAGNTLAWLIEPQLEDTIWIEFTLPKRITKITIRTGSKDHTEDTFGDETVLMATKSGEEKEHELARFAANGTLMYTAVTPVSIEKLVIRVQRSLRHWVIIDEVKIEYVH